MKRAEEWTSDAQVSSKVGITQNHGPASQSLYNADVWPQPPANTRVSSGLRARGARSRSPRSSGKTSGLARYPRASTVRGSKPSGMPNNAPLQRGCAAFQLRRLARKKRVDSTGAPASRESQTGCRQPFPPCHSIPYNMADGQRSFRTQCGQSGLRARQTRRP